MDGPMEAARRAEKEAEERKKKEQEESLAEGFAGVNKPKKSFFSGTTYPLHKAAEAGNAKIAQASTARGSPEVGGLLEQGANPAQKNSSGKTAQEARGKGLHADEVRSQPVVLLLVVVGVVVVVVVVVVGGC
eukprot:Skav201691  [mRNA]  locus=scaffold641:709505:714361:+ [translate_table: standard]